MLYHILLTLIPGSWQVLRCLSRLSAAGTGLWRHGHGVPSYQASQPAGSFSSQLTVFSIYIIYNQPLQSTQANGIANTTQTPQLEPHLSLTLNLPHSLVARLPQVPKLEIPQTPKEVSKILFAQRAATDEY